MASEIRNPGACDTGAHRGWAELRRISQGVDAMRLIVQPIAGGFELCARLGLLLIPGEKLGSTGRGGKIVRAVLVDSPTARAGVAARDIIFSVDKTHWDSIRHLTFSDRRPSELNLSVFVARYFVIANITVRVLPKHYRPIEDIVAEAMQVVTTQPMPRQLHYVNPRFAETRELLSMLRRRRRR